MVSPVFVFVRPTTLICSIFILFYIQYSPFKDKLILFTAPDTLFDWIKDELCTYEDEKIQCPKCEEIWNIEEVLERCNLSEDETIFFKRVKEIYTATKTFMQRCYGNLGDDEEIADDDDDDSSNSLFLP